MCWSLLVVKRSAVSSLLGPTPSPPRRVLAWPELSFCPLPRMARISSVPSMCMDRPISFSFILPSTTS